MVVGSKNKFKVFCGIFDLGSCNDNIVAHSLLAWVCCTNLSNWVRIHFLFPFHISGYVGKYFDEKNGAFLYGFMRYFEHLYAKFLSDNQT